MSDRANMQPAPLAVTAQTAAKMTGLSKRAILLYVESGDLKASRPGKTTLIEVDELRAWLMKHRIGAKNG